MAGYVEIMTLFTLTNKVAYVAVRYFYAELGENCAEACQRLGDFECHFDHFFGLTLDERKVIMFNASKEIASPIIWDKNFAMDGSAEMRSFLLPGFVVATKKIIGYKITNYEGETTWSCNAKLYTTTQRRLCSCRKKKTFREFFVGQPGTKCIDTCLCRRMHCVYNFLYDPPTYKVNEAERMKVLYATAKLYQEYKKISPINIKFSLEATPKQLQLGLDSNTPYFSKNTTIYGWQDTFAGDCRIDGSANHQGFCECYHPFGPLEDFFERAIDLSKCDIMGGGETVRAWFMVTLVAFLIIQLLN